MAAFEADDPQGVSVLTFEKVGDDGFEVGGLFVGLTPCAAVSA
jgi:hypothetical protein